MASEFKVLKIDSFGISEDGRLTRGTLTMLDLQDRASQLTEEGWRLVTVDAGYWVFERPLR